MKLVLVKLADISKGGNRVNFSLIWQTFLKNILTTPNIDYAISFLHRFVFFKKENIKSFMIEANCSPTNGLPVILDIVGTHCRAVDTIKHDGVYVNRHRIPGEDLKSFKSGSFFTISRQLILSVR